MSQLQYIRDYNLKLLNSSENRWFLRKLNKIQKITAISLIFIPRGSPFLSIYVCSYNVELSCYFFFLEIYETLLKRLRPDPLPSKKKKIKKKSHDQTRSFVGKKTLPVGAEMFTTSICTSVPFWVLALFFMCIPVGTYSVSFFLLRIISKFP